MMRGWPGALFAILVSSCSAQDWRIGDEHQLLWQGQPYLPVGVRTPYDDEHLKALKSAGIKDALVDLPLSGEVWKSAISGLEAAGVRYMIAISSLAPPCNGYSVDPPAYSIALTAPKQVNMTFPGSTKVLVAVYEAGSKDIAQFQLYETPGGHLDTTLNCIEGLDSVATFYPLGRTLELPDFWDGFDDLRDQLLARFTENKPGPGFRGLLNPLGTLTKLPERSGHVVPASKQFQMSFADYLRERYRQPEIAIKNWGLQATTITSIDELARLVPLWYGNKGLAYFYDPAKNERYDCDPKKSTYWQDMQTTINRTVATRYEHLIKSLRGVVPGPIVQDWAGYSLPYEGESTLDGIGCQASVGTYSQTLDSVGPALSATFRQGRPIWSVATNVTVASPKELGPAIQDLSSAGIRAWYVDGTDLSLWPAIGRAANDVGPSQTLPAPLYYPTGANNPAHCSILPGGRIWLPSPEAGVRMELGSRFSGYQLGTDSIVLWSNGGQVRTKLLMSESDIPKQIQFLPIDATQVKPKKVREGYEVTIGEYPVIIKGLSDWVVPESAVELLKSHEAQLVKRAEDTTIDLLTENAEFGQATDALSRNPGRAYFMMVNLYNRMCSKAGTSAWIEAETAGKSLLVETAVLPGCSGAGALLFRSNLGQLDMPVAVEYSLPFRRQSEQTVWIAAKIPEGFSSSISLSFGRQTLKLEPRKIGSYGSGFDWYRCGKLTLFGSNGKLKLSCSPPPGVEIAVDSLLLTPGSFVPNGLTRPEPIAFKDR